MKPVHVHWKTRQAIIRQHEQQIRFKVICPQGTLLDLNLAHMRAFYGLLHDRPATITLRCLEVKLPVMDAILMEATYEPTRKYKARW